jgi:hypothetical protein
MLFCQTKCLDMELSDAAFMIISVCVDHLRPRLSSSRSPGFWYSCHRVDPACNIHPHPLVLHVRFQRSAHRQRVAIDRVRPFCHPMDEVSWLP